MTFKRMTAVLAATVTFAAAGTAPLLAQNTESAPAAPAPAQPEMSAPAAADFTDDQLEAFAVAFVEVSQIGQQYDQQLQNAEGDEEMMDLQMQAQEEMVTAVEGTDGISVDEYNAIYTALQSDPEVGERVQSMIQEKMQQ